jgi:GNAT superfamily N-acetyltransferase
MHKTKLIKDLYYYRGKSVHRIILGNPVSGELSQIREEGNRRVTGTIGFLDFNLEKDSENFLIYSVGVEPPYTRNGNFSHLLKVAERMARITKCNSIELDNIINDSLSEYFPLRGYKRMNSLKKNFIKKIGLR